MTTTTMSNEESPPSVEGDSDEEADSTEELRREDLLARIDVLEEENERLRAEFTRAQRVRNRRTAAGFAGLGLLCVLGGVLFPGVRSVLFALGGTGLFAAILTTWVTPERFVSADVGERVYAALASNHAAMTAELGLTGTPVYVPRRADVRLWVSQADGNAAPEPAALDDTFVVGEAADDRGVALEPTGRRLVESLNGVGTDPEIDVGMAATTLASALVETFEIADSAESNVDRSNGRATFEITGAIYGDPNRFDHPVTSILGVGLAETLDESVRVEVADTEPLVVTCRWKKSS